MIEMVYNGRYTILLMAMFSVYIGALYNELFALPMNFGSNWEFVNLPPYNTFKPISDWYAACRGLFLTCIGLIPSE